MQAMDFGLAFMLLIVMAFYLFRHYSMISRIWLATVSCGLFAIAVVVSFGIRWML